jgi:hypothetical protein
MTRYRIEVWQTDKPDVVMRKHRQYNCKLCAVKYAVELAQGYQRGLHLSEGGVKWSVSKMFGHLQGWAIVHHSGQPIAGLAFKHGH